MLTQDFEPRLKHETSKRKIASRKRVRRIFFQYTSGIFVDISSGRERKNIEKK